MTPGPATGHPESGPHLRIGQVVRYVQKSKRDSCVELIDGLTNFYRATHLASSSAVLMEKGINPIGTVSEGPVKRRPAVLIRSSPHKQGREETPWHDLFDVDVGHIRYFGDNKPRPLPDGSWKVGEAARAPGNQLLTTIREMHQSPLEADRVSAPPLLFFRAVPVPGRAKGQVEFQGYGVIDTVGLVTQFHPQSGLYFSNLVFDFVVLQVDDEALGFDWKWVNLRRTASISDRECLKAAPAAWRIWAHEGSTAVERVRRRVSRLAVKRRDEQLPWQGSREDTVLSDIVDFYSRARDSSEALDQRTTSLGASVPASKARFEALAELIAGRVLQTPDKRYSPRWITRGSGDEGVDFVVRLTVGSGFSSVDLVVLGQAKCESRRSATGGLHIARTVARLQRGWLGVYVTTSHFSQQVQQEVIEDGYPIVLVPGRTVAEVVTAVLKERAINLLVFLREIDNGYESRLSYRRPHEAVLPDHPDPHTK